MLPIKFGLDPCSGFRKPAFTDDGRLWYDSSSTVYTQAELKIKNTYLAQKLSGLYCVHEGLDFICILL